MPADFYATDLAYVHHAGFGGFATGAAPGLLAALDRSRVSSRVLVDLGCGSGIWLAQAARAGYQTVGVDISPAMLRLARENSPSSKLFCASVYNFSLPRCNAVTAIGEVLCYAAPGIKGSRSLRPLFQRVATALPPGGTLIFDLIMADPRRSMNNRLWRAGNDWAVLVEIQDQQSLIVRNMTIFRKAGNRYRRSFERHKARVYDMAEVKEDLRQVGFSVVTRRRYGKFSLPPRRMAFFATKRT